MAEITSGLAYRKVIRVISLSTKDCFGQHIALAMTKNKRTQFGGANAILKIRQTSRAEGKSKID